MADITDTIKIVFTTLWYLFVFLLFLVFLILLPFIAYMKFKKKPNSIPSKLNDDFSAIFGFLTLGKTISAILYILPNTKRLATFRNFQYYNYRAFGTTSLILCLPVVITYYVSDANFSLVTVILLIIFAYFFLLHGIFSEIVKERTRFKTKQDLFNNRIELKGKKENINYLITLLEYDHSSFCRELVELNMSIFEEMKKFIPKEKFYRLENMEEFYRNNLNKYWFRNRLFWISPTVVLFSEKYSKKINSIFEENINELKNDEYASPK